MEPSALPDLSTHLSEKEGLELIRIARASIAHGVEHGRPIATDPLAFSAALQAQRASFVTLHSFDQLRGCIGTLTATRPLVEDVAINAYGAAFRDSRFPPVKAQELSLLDVHLSILGPSTPIPQRSEDDVLRQLRPGVDGITLQDGTRRATFLPIVWETLPDPRQFLAQLKLKAGIPAAAWPATMQVWRYEVEDVP